MISGAHTLFYLAQTKRLALKICGEYFSFTLLNNLPLQQ